MWWNRSKQNLWVGGASWGVFFLQTGPDLTSRDVTVGILLCSSSSGWNFISAIISNLLKYLRVLNSIGEERFSYSQRVEPIFLAVHTPLIFFFFVFCSYYSTVVPHVKSDNYANRSFYRKICERRIPDFVDTSFDTLFNTHLRLTPTNPNLA